MQTFHCLQLDRERGEEKMTHGYQWIQEIPVRQVYPSRGLHVNETNKLDAHSNGRNTSRSVVHYTPSVSGSEQWQPQQTLRLNSDPRSRQNNHRLMLKAPVRNGEKPIQLNMLHRRQPDNLKPWESTGSLISNPAPMFKGETSNRHPKTWRSVSHPRAVKQLSVSHHQTPVPLTGYERSPDVNEMVAFAPQQRNQPNRQLKLHNDPFNHPFFQNKNSNMVHSNQLSFADEKVNPTVQESFRWKDETDNREHQVPVNYNPNNSRQNLIVAAPQYPTMGRSSEMDARQKNIPPTKSSQKRNHEQHMTMGRASNNGMNGNREAPGLSALPPLPNRNPRENMRRQNAMEVIVDRPVDDGVIYTDIAPQTSTLSRRTPERSVRPIRSRSCSPVIYTEVVPSTAPAQNGSTSKNRQKSKKNRHDATDSMTFGSDLATDPPVNHSTLRRLQSWKEPGKQQMRMGDNHSQLSQTPSEYSISLGTPHLELKRMNTDFNNNQKRLHRSSSDKTKPFPNSASLDQMLLSDSSSSKKSGTIKSVLKQPSDKFPISRESRGNRSPKRVTIRENDNRFLPSSNGILQTTYRTNPASGLVKAPPRLSSNQRPADHKFKVINRKLVMVT